MAKERETPEEKLLKVIDNPAQAKRRVSPAALMRGKGPLAGITAWLGTLKLAPAGAAPKLTLHAVNVWLVVIGGVLTIVWCVDFFAMRTDLLTRLETVERTQLAAPEEVKAVAPPALDFAKVLESAKERNLFTFLPPKVEAPPPAVVEELGNAVKDLRLVGIIWSDNPQAIIEQSKEGKTSLLGTGEAIGSLRIKKILKDKVILSDKEERTHEWELR